MKFRSMISQVGKPVDATEALEGRSSRWVANRFGVSMRTAQRWRKGTQEPSAREGRRDQVMASASRAKVAANAIRNARAVSAGKVGVKSDTGRAGARTGTRNVGFVELDSGARERMDEAADMLDAGDYEGAQQLMSDAVLNTGGRDYGPLHIEDYPPGFHLI
jgi:hypothetical protein